MWILLYSPWSDEREKESDERGKEIERERERERKKEREKEREISSHPHSTCSPRFETFYPKWCGQAHRLSKDP